MLPLLSFSSRDAATSIVGKALAAVLPAYNSKGELDESQELYADLAIDSLRFIRLIAELEKELGQEINDEDLFDTDLITVADLVKFVAGMIRT